MSAREVAAGKVAGGVSNQLVHRLGGCYPQAEWQQARTILMHTPGLELFDGVVHPSAGLFEHYFDGEKAAREHMHYIELLQAQGIRVVTVADILNKVDHERLVSLAAKELSYDISHLPDMDMAASENYRQEVLHSMSRHDLIRCILLHPEVELHATDSNTGYAARYISNPLINLYFTRDQSITTPRGHILCRMNSPQRAAETAVIKMCYDFLGASPILRIKGEGRMEGGDYMPAGRFSFIGCGMRTNDEAIRQVMEADAFGHDTVVVVRDHKLWQKQMHLDTYFNLIDSDLCTLVESRFKARSGDPEFVTCDIYQRRRGEKAYRLAEKDLSFVDFLLGSGFTIIAIGRKDELHYANNFLTVGPRHIMAVGHQSESLARALDRHDVKVEWVPLENLICGYGAAHCMTQVLQRY